MVIPWYGRPLLSRVCRKDGILWQSSGRRGKRLTNTGASVFEESKASLDISQIRRTWWTPPGMMYLKVPCLWPVCIGCIKNYHPQSVCVYSEFHGHTCQQEDALDFWIIEARSNWVILSEQKSLVCCVARSSMIDDCHTGIKGLACFWSDKELPDFRP